MPREAAVVSARRRELLMQARALLERQGIESFSMHELAREAGIKAPSLYKHFSGIEDVFLALISEGFREFARDIGKSLEPLALRDVSSRVKRYAEQYRSYALENPQLYRLMTERPLDRDALEDGAEQEGMAELVGLFGESFVRHEKARAAWAWMHGLVSLEIAGRFPPGTNVSLSWDLLAHTLERVAGGSDARDDA